MESSQRSRNAAPSARREQLRAHAAQQLPGDAPVDEADAELQRADPVGPPAFRALLDPRIDLRLDGERISRVARERMRLRQQRQVQVPVRLPQVLDVADFAFVAIVDGAGAPRRPPPAASAGRDSIAADRRARNPRDRRRCTCPRACDPRRRVRCSGAMAMNGGRKRRSRADASRGGVSCEANFCDSTRRLARQPVRHFGARHHFETLQIPSRLLHASPREQRLHAMAAKRIRGAIVVVRIAPDQHLPEHVLFHEPGKGTRPRSCRLPHFRHRRDALVDIRESPRVGVHVEGARAFIGTPARREARRLVADERGHRRAQLCRIARDGPSILPAP